VFFFVFFHSLEAVKRETERMGLLDDLWKIPLLALFSWEVIFSQCHFSGVDREREREKEERMENMRGKKKKKKKDIE
jgi:hypothetical protein